MKKNLKIYSFLFLLLLSAGINAQNTTPLIQSKLDGTVVDDVTNQPIIGASVIIKGTTHGVQTDAEGKFYFQTGQKFPYTLIVTYIGYKKAEIIVEKNPVTINLKEERQELDELVVVGYGSQKRKDITGSVASVPKANLTQVTSSADNLLRGAIAGVVVTQSSGRPGASSSVRIRGGNSITAGNEPLYVVDGILIYNDNNNSTAGVTNAGATVNVLSTINPGDIESIEVLKDASATAIYGSRGANGVVLISTKKGKEGKTRFTINTNTALGTVTRFMDLMHSNDYLKMRKEAFANDGIVKYPAAAYDVNGTWDQNRYTDWQKVLTGGTAQISDLQASITGGSVQTQFLISGNYHNETTVFPGDYKYKRGGVNFNLNHQSADNKFKVNFSASYSSQNNNLPGTDFTRESRSLAPNAPALYDSRGKLNWENGTFNNPLRNLEAIYKAKTGNLIANTILSYQILPDLEIKTSIGFTDLHYDETRTSPSTIYNPSLGLGSESSSLFINNSTRESWIIEPQINWNKKIGNGKIELLAGATFQQQKTGQLVQEADGFTSNNLIYDLASATYLYVFTNQQTQYKYQAFFGRTNFSWKERYIVNLTGRRDGSSRFGPGNQFANFGAIGVAWLFSKEPILENKIISFGKLRYSYGTTGNDQIGDYNFLDTYSSAGNNYQGVVGLQPNRLYNPNFGWETNRKIEIALELGFLQDRILDRKSVV